MAKTYRIVLLLFTVMICLISCSNIAMTESLNPTSASPESLNWETLSNEPAYYLKKAQAARTDEKTNYQLLAVQSMIQQGNITQANQYLQSIEINTQNKNLFARKQLLLGLIDLMDNKSIAVINKLNAITNPPALPIALQIQFHKMQATAYARAGDHYRSIKERMIVNTLIQNPEAQFNNQRMIWHQLQGLSLNTLQEQQKLAQKDNEKDLYGWLRLAFIEKKYRNEHSSLLQQIKAWQAHFPNHPANKLLPASLTVADNGFANDSDSKNITLLLPLHGPLKKAGEAVRDGFMDAYYETLSRGGSHQPEIHVIDTSSTYDIVGLYHNAVANGSTTIVGPLNKHNVDVLAKSDVIRIPTLALNYSRYSSASPANFYQFGLSPLDEASQAAERAWSDKHNRALIVFPKGRWGDEVANTFSKRFQDLGGIVVDQMPYRGIKGLSNQIKHLLQVDNSALRANRVSETIHTSIGFVPRRRHDVDLIFLVANPNAAQQIRPLLKFYYAGDITVFATSSIYSGIPNQQRNHDLDGIIFSDIPWILSTSPDIVAKQKKLYHLWPERYDNYVRLYALGMDAYQLSQALDQLNAFPQFEIPGATGYLTMDDNKRIQRKLNWALMQDGKPIPLG